MDPSSREAEMALRKATYRDGPSFRNIECQECLEIVRFDVTAQIHSEKE